MLEDLREIVFYNRINKSLGVKFIIQCSSDVTNEEITDIYSRLSLSCFPMLNSGKEYDLRSICLDTLEMLPGNLDRYPRIIVLYDNSMEDKIYNVDLNNLDNYDGDMMKMENGELVLYSDRKNRVIIKNQKKLESGETIYGCMIGRNESEIIPNLFDDESNSPYVSFAKEFVSSVFEITKRKSKGHLRELKNHYEK